MPKAIRFFRSVPRWLVVRGLFPRFPAIATGAFSCIELAESAPPALPNGEWVRIKTRLSGVCGSDLSAIACQGSPYFSPFVSTPFVLGHELVGDIVELGSSVPPAWKTGMRVVIEPALCCTVRGIQPLCKPCAAGEYAHCENILKGCIQGGIQTGYCASTGGGWSAATLVAHHSQLHAVPEGLSDEEAVLAEPFACAIHAAFLAPREPQANVLFLGSGTIGLLALYAYCAAGGQGQALVSARFDVQAEMARKYGASDVLVGLDIARLYKWVLEHTGGSAHQPELGKPVLLGGADCVVDCVGSSRSIDDAMRLTRPRGTLVLAGMPGIPRGVDWTSVWYKALRVRGSYAYGWETLAGGAKAKTMALALEYLAKSAGALKPLVNRKYPLEEYRAALAGAWQAGKNGAFKTVFEARQKNS
jgi:threonine dehydrogenase-like Zn-dependent dehydrogenase